MRKRTIKKYGNTWIIKLNPTDIKDFNLKIGDEVDVEELVIIRRRKKK